MLVAALMAVVAVNLIGPLGIKAKWHGADYASYTLVRLLLCGGAVGRAGPSCFDEFVAAARWFHLQHPGALICVALERDFPCVVSSRGLFLPHLFTTTHPPHRCSCSSPAPPR